eukprot:scaffold422724_cov63-Attheya_sp.AAC.1
MVAYCAPNDPGSRSIAGQIFKFVNGVYTCLDSYVHVCGSAAFQPVLVHTKPGVEYLAVLLGNGQHSDLFKTE